MVEFPHPPNVNEKRAGKRPPYATVKWCPKRNGVMTPEDWANCSHVERLDNTTNGSLNAQFNLDEQL